MASSAPSITTFHGPGFSPADLHLAKAARLRVGRVLRLHPGTTDTLGAAFHTHVVRVDRSVSFSVPFTIAAAPGVTLGGGFAVVLQNDLGYIPPYTTPNTLDPDRLGTFDGCSVAVVFRVDGGVSSYGIKLGAPNPPYGYGPYTGLSHASPPSTPVGPQPPGPPDFTLGRRFDPVVTITRPTLDAGTDGTIHLTLTDTVSGQTWTLLYTGIPWLRRFFRVDPVVDPPDPDGTQAYVGFTSMSGPTTAARVDLHSFTWIDPLDPAPTVHATGILPVTTAGRYSAGDFDAAGRMVRTYFDGTYLDVGDYPIVSDGRDEYGGPLSGVHTFRAIRSTATGGSFLVGQVPGLDTTKEWMGLSGAALVGIAVSGDGADVVATGGYALDATPHVAYQILDGATGLTRDAETSWLRAGTRVGGDGVCFIPGTNLYLVLTNNDEHRVSITDPPRDKVYRIVKRSVTPVVDETTQFSSPIGTTNPSGWTVVNCEFYRPKRVLELSLGDQFSDTPSIISEAITRIAAGATTCVVASRRGNLVYEFDHTTGLDVGTPIAVKQPRAVAYLPDGNIAVAHAAHGPDFGLLPTAASFAYGQPATIVTVYAPTTHAVVRVMTGPGELVGFEDIVGLSCTNGRLLIADNGPARKCVEVHAISGSTAGALLATRGTPATWANDNGRDTFWHLRDAAIDDAGNVTIASRLNGIVSRDRGAMIRSWTLAGVERWNRFSLGYTATMIVGPAGEPDVGISTTNQAMRVDPVTGVSTHLRSALPPSALVNPWLNQGHYNTQDGWCQARTPLKWLRLGGVDFLAWQGRHGMILHRHLGGGKLRPAAAFGRTSRLNANPWIWSDLGTGGDPADSDIVSQVAPADLAGVNWAVYLADDGTAFLVEENSTDLWKVPPPTLNAAGNPAWNWALASPVTTPAGGGYGSFSARFGAASDDTFYLLADDLRFGPNTSRSAGAYNFDGCRILFAFNLDGTRRWAKRLPEGCQSIAAYPGGVVVGGLLTSKFHLYRSDALHVLSIDPATIRDVLDFPGGTMSASRAPGGIIQVGSEGIKWCGFLYSPVDDRAAVPAYSATMVAGQTVTLSLAGGSGPAVPRFRLTRAPGGPVTFSLRSSTP